MAALVPFLDLRRARTAKENIGGMVTTPQELGMLNSVSSAGWQELQSMSIRHTILINARKKIAMHSLSVEELGSARQQ